MIKYKVKIDPEALTDIQGITLWYNEHQPGLGRRFQYTTVKQINSLQNNPQIYAVRYKEIRCMIVEVLAVISTSRNPKIWTEKSSKNT